MPLRFHSPAATESQTTPNAAAPVVSSSVLVEIASESEVESYLLQVESHLKRVPAAIRADARRELQTHLESLIAAHVEIGDERDAALAAALRQIGKPEMIATHYRRAWAAPALYRRREALRDTGRFAALAVALAIFAFYALLVLIDQVFHFNRSGNTGIALFLDAVGLPLVSQISLLVPLLIGRQYGKRWAQTRKVNIRFWLLLAAQTAAWSVAQQFLTSLLVVRGHYRLIARWELIEILESQFLYTVPLAILAALYTYRRRTASSRSASVSAYAAFAGWMLVVFLDQLNLYAYIPHGLKSIVLHTAEHYYFLAILAIVCVVKCQQQAARKDALLNMVVSS